MKFLKKEQGQSLIEVVVALSVASIVITSLFRFSNSSSIVILSSRTIFFELLYILRIFCIFPILSSKSAEPRLSA